MWCGTQHRLVARLQRTLTVVGIFSLIICCAPLSGAPQRERYIAGHYVEGSPHPELRSPGEAAALARNIAAANPGAFVIRGQGESMQPLYPSGTLLVVLPLPYEQLRRGMTVMFRQDGTNRAIAHVLVAKTSNGWRTAGLKNRRDDYVSVNPGNIAGAVIAAFTEIEGRRVTMR
jgi:hypothetical protein